VARRRSFGYSITLAQVGPIHDPDFIRATDKERKQVLDWIVAFGLKEKDQDLAEGLDRFGAPMIPITAQTRKYRKSAMGAANPANPPLTPAGAVSRTRLLLTGEVNSDGKRADFWWEFDDHTGGSWGKILNWHRKGIGRSKTVRDVIGISQAAIGRIRTVIAARWQLYKLHQLRTPARAQPPEPAIPAPRLVTTGSTDYEHFTFGVGGTEARLRASISSTGFRQKRIGPDGVIYRGQPPPQFPPRNPPPPPPRPLPAPASLGLSFTPSPAAKSQKATTVKVDVARFNEGWRLDMDYVPPGGREDQKQKYVNAVAFVQKAQAEGITVEQPRTTVDPDGTVTFADGRHRFAAMRDLGASVVPVSVDKRDANRATRIYAARKNMNAP
jgi:hypothetical protein